MSIAKRVTYLKGLTEGLGLGNETKEERILHTIIEILDDISVELEELAEDVSALDDDVSVLIEDVEGIEDVLADGDEEGHVCAHSREPTFYTVKCPSCADEITIDEDVLNLGSIDCPNCGEKLELDLDE